MTKKNNGKILNESLLLQKIRGVVEEMQKENNITSMQVIGVLDMYKYIIENTMLEVAMENNKVNLK